MEAVIAYKAFNGKLFDTEEKCVAYEKKMAQYPKVIHRTSNAQKAQPLPGMYIDVDIVKHEINTWEKPYSQKKVEVYYMVNSKYKFTDSCEEAHMLCGVLDVPISPTYEYGHYYMIDRLMARLAFSEKGITDQTINEVVEKYHNVDKFSKMTVEIVIPNKKWIIGDKRWETGQIMRKLVTIEKIN